MKPVENSTGPGRPCPGAEIVEDLAAAIAGASSLIASNAPADDIACARTLLMQARESVSTLREVIRHA